MKQSQNLKKAALCHHCVWACSSARLMESLWDNALLCEQLPHSYLQSSVQVGQDQNCFPLAEAQCKGGNESVIPNPRASDLCQQEQFRGLLSLEMMANQRVFGV